MLLKSAKDGTHFVLIGVPADPDDDEASDLYIVAERTAEDEARGLPFFFVYSSEDFNAAEAQIKSLASGKVVAANPSKRAAKATNGPVAKKTTRKIAK